MATANSTDVVVVGGGLAGLTATLTLQAAGKTVKLVEATDRVGGRMKTDTINGFLCDRGFQVLLTAYPECQRWLNYEQLQLKAFDPGALVLHKGGTYGVYDPARQPGKVFGTLFSGIGSLSDKLKVYNLKRRMAKKSIEAIFDSPEQPTIEALQGMGFSQRMINNFFMPFFGGIYLEDALATSNRMFEFVYKMFSAGNTSVPAQGMEAIPKQLAERLAPGTLVTDAKVATLADGRVTTTDGRVFEGSSVLLATAAPELAGLGQQAPKQGNAVTNIYFHAPTAPLSTPTLVLNAAAPGNIKNIAVMNNVAPAYAPLGRHLISISLTGIAKHDDQALAESVKQALAQWYATDQWQLLQAYRIPYALPNQAQVANHAGPEHFTIGQGLYRCGDHLLNGSINAAMKSGRLAAEAILANG